MPVSCGFCGRKLTSSHDRKRRPRCHWDCAVWSPFVTPEGDVLQCVEQALEVARATPCSRCRRKGASVSCREGSCEGVCHYRCAEREGWLFLRDAEVQGEFVYCSKHADLLDDEIIKGQKFIFKVERILDHRFVRGKIQYQVKWEGFPQEEATWEPEDNIFDPAIIENYDRSRGASTASTRKRSRSSQASQHKNKKRKTNQSDSEEHAVEANTEADAEEAPVDHGYLNAESGDSDHWTSMDNETIQSQVPRRSSKCVEFFPRISMIPEYERPIKPLNIVKFVAPRRIGSLQMELIGF